MNPSRDSQAPNAVNSLDQRMVSLLSSLPDNFLVSGTVWYRIEYPRIHLPLYKAMQRKKTVLIVLLVLETILLFSLFLKWRVFTDKTWLGCQHIVQLQEAPSPVAEGRKLHGIDDGSPTTESGSRRPISDPLIFVGGVPRSGTTLMRVLLDAHPDIRCGEETRIIPRILFMLSNIRKSDLEVKRLREAGISDSLLNSAVKPMIETIITGHGLPSKYLCNKDPLSLRSLDILDNMFPAAKFILMVRDGRATANSIMSRSVTIAGVDNQDMYNVMDFWNRTLTQMLNQCKERPGKCIVVYYERLILNPKRELQRILSFLSIPWHDNVLNHHVVMTNSSTEIAISK